MAGNGAKVKTGSAKNVKELDLKVSELHTYFESQMDKFRDEISKVKTPESIVCDTEMSTDMESLAARFSFFQSTVKNELQKITASVSQLKSSQENIKIQVGIMHVDRYRNKLLLHGVEEKRGEDLLSVASAIMQKHLKINIEKTEFNNCYRLSSRKSTTDNRKKPRPIAIEFLNAWRKTEVYRTKRLLKGTKLVITEMLPVDRLSLYRAIKSEYKTCWTRDLKIGFLDAKGVVHYVTTRQQFASVTSGRAGGDVETVTGGLPGPLSSVS